jgi:hypothetical protein
MSSNTYKIACVWVKDRWLSIAKISIMRYYKSNTKTAVQFSYHGTVYESYIEFIDINDVRNTSE